MNQPADTILIVEDDPIIAEDIRLSLSIAGYEIAGIAPNADAAIKILKNSSVELAILDIRIDGSIDGIVLGGIIKDQFDIPVIFLTSFTDKDTIEKVKSVKPAGYLVKPFDDIELVTNVDLAILQAKDGIPPRDHEIEKVKDKTAFIRHNGSLVKINLDDILYAEASDNYCFIHTLKTKFLLSQTLKSIEEKLDKARFMRVHRSYLVNLHAIEVISEDHLIINDKHITISRTSKQELMNRISLL